jgi:hypothetical protein
MIQSHSAAAVIPEEERTLPLVDAAFASSVSAVEDWRGQPTSGTEYRRGAAAPADAVVDEAQQDEDGNEEVEVRNQLIIRSNKK